MPLTIDIERLFDQKYRDISVPFPVSGATDGASGGFATLITGVVGDGTADDSAAFRTALATGGCYYIAPATYVASDIYLASNTTLLIAEGTVFKPPRGTLATDTSTFRLHTSDRTSTSYIQNVHIIGLGQWTIDHSAYTPPGGTNPRGINILNCEDFTVTNVVGHSLGGLAGNTIAIGSNQAATHPRRGRFQNIYSTGVIGIGASCIQMTGGYEIEADGLFADGGVPARIETDNNTPAVVENVHMRRIRLTNESGLANACGYFVAHTNTIRHTTISDFAVETVGDGIHMSYSPGGNVSYCTAKDGYVHGGGAGVAVQIVDLSAYPTFPGCVFERIHANASTAVEAFGIADGITYRDCIAANGTNPGFGASNVQGGSSIPTPVAGTTCHISGGLAFCNAPTGIAADGVERVVLTSVESHDTAARVATPLGSELVSNTGFETNTTGWSGAGTPASTIARVTTQHNTGTASLSITPAASGEADAKTTIGTGGFAVTPGHVYQCSVWAKADAGATPRPFSIVLWFFNSSGTFTVAVGISTNTQSSSSAWAQASGLVTAPAGAAFGAAIVAIRSTAGSADVHYIDDVSVKDATGTATQKYGATCGANTTLVLAGGTDLSTNGTGRFSSLGTVQEAVLSTVTS